MKKLPLSLVLVGIWAPAVCVAEPEPPRGEPAPPPPDSPWHNRQHQSPDGWKKADSDGDGFISRAEFGAMPRLENLPADKQDALFKRLDKDGNGSLSREELDRLFKPQDPRRPMFPRLAELDTDKNGSISLAEFKAGEIFKKLPPEGQDELFRRLDADGDGAITPKDSPPRTRPTADLTVDCRCEVPMNEAPVSARARRASTRTLDGPLPKRPSAGSRSSGMRMSEFWVVMRGTIPVARGRFCWPIAGGRWRGRQRRIRPEYERSSGGLENA